MLSVDISLFLSGEKFSYCIDFPDGITAIVGRSGSGKTMLANCISGIVRPQEGRIYIDSKCFFDSSKHINLSPQKRGVGFVFQSHRLFPHLDVRTNLEFGMKFGNRKASLSTEEVCELLELVPLLGRKADSLSGGEAQRVALGRALLSAETLLIMDEPLSSVDPRLKENLLNYFERVKAVFHRPILYITHSPAEAKRLADRSVLISQGKVVATGGTQEILNHPIYKGDLYEIN